MLALCLTFLMMIVEQGVGTPYPSPWSPRRASTTRW